MRKTALICLLFLSMFQGLKAYPQPIIRLGGTKDNPLDPVALHLQKDQLYIMDNHSRQLLLYDVSAAKITKSILRLGKSSDISDVYVHEDQIYLLDGKNSGVRIFDKDGKELRKFFTNKIRTHRFKGAKSIVVNYQGFIYVLDSTYLRAYTGEGMPFAQVEIVDPVAMSIAEDQLIRVLRKGSKHNVVDYLDQYLKPVSASQVRTHEYKISNMADIAVNHWGEMHVINKDEINISKLGPNGAILPNTQFGSFEQSNRIGGFQNPARIRCSAHEGSSIIAILDTEQKAIHVFRDTESFTQQQLSRPAYTMRPCLSEAELPSAKDFMVLGDITFMISNLAKSPNARAELCVWAFDRQNNTLFAKSIRDIGNRKAKSLDALAVNNEKLYVLDTGAATVHVFDSVTGAYQTSFAEKGRRDNNLSKPVDIAVDKNKLIYIADNKASRISIFNEHNIFIRNINMPSHKSKPLKLKYKDDILYILCSDGNIYMHDVDNPRPLQILASAEDLSAFEHIYEGKLALVNGESQVLSIVSDKGLEYEFFAHEKNSTFPFFGDITGLYYIEDERKLVIMDSQASKLRYLTFFAALDRPDVIQLTINDATQAELVWERQAGIEAWVVHEISERDTIYHNVEEPKFTIIEPQNNIKKYQICSIAADGKKGELSLPIEDAYSYARYLEEQGSYLEANYALYQSGKNIADDRLDDEIIQNYIRDAEFHEKSKQYAKALNSLELAARVKGPNQQIALKTVNIYRIMGDYRKGLDYLDRYGNQDSAELMEQYISLQYHLKDFIGLIPKATQYRKKFGFNQDVLHHAVEAYTSLGQYREALSTLDEIVAINPSFEDKLRQADLQIRMGNLSSANSHLQRMLIDYRNEELDRVYALLGDCNYRLEQYGYAADYLINAININNREADYYFLLAETYHETRNRTEALKNYALAFQLAPEQADYGMGYARALERENRFSEALGILDSIAEIAKEYFSTADFHRLYSDLLLREGRYDDAYREILIVQNYFPEDEEIARKVEEAFQAREYYNQNKAPVEIKTVEFDPVYPSLYEYYKQNPVGSVKLFNNRSVPITDIQVQVILPEVTDRNYSVSIPSLTANDVYEQLLVLELNRRIFNQKRDINPRISISYTFEDSIYTAEYDKAKLSILPDKAMNWNNRQQYASFVNPGDEALRTFVTSTVLQSFSGSSNTEIPSSIQKALQIYNFYRANHIRFANDPSLSNIHNTQIDLVQYPFQTLNSKAGDCDDLLVLLAASLEVIGVETGFIDIPGHVMLAIDTNLNLDQIMKTGLAVEYFISRNDTYWLPLESTTLGTHDFNQSWLAAIRRYDEEVKKGVFPEIFKFAQLHISYPPAPYSKPIETAQYANKTLALSYANEDISRITHLSQISQEQEFLETLKRYPNNLIVKNKYARWSLSNGKSEQGERLLLEILEADPTNFTALVNLGNLYYFGARYSLARAQFLQALQQNKDTDELYRNLCLVEYRDNNKSRALEYFRKIQNKDLVKNADFTIYSELIQQGE